MTAQSNAVDDASADNSPWWEKAIIWVLQKVCILLVYMAMIWTISWWLNFTVVAQFHGAQKQHLEGCIAGAGSVVVGPFGGVTCHWPNPKGEKAAAR